MTTSISSSNLSLKYKAISALLQFQIHSAFSNLSRSPAHQGPKSVFIVFTLFCTANHTSALFVVELFLISPALSFALSVFGIIAEMITNIKNMINIQPKHHIFFLCFSAFCSIIIFF